MLSGDPRKWSTPQKEHARVELDQRAHDARLGLERIERRFAQRAGPMMPAQTESLIFLAQASMAKGRQIPRIQPRNPCRRAGRRSSRRPVPACQII
jgi:hypothetical protein